MSIGINTTSPNGQIFTFTSPISASHILNFAKLAAPPKKIQFQADRTNFYFISKSPGLLDLGPYLSPATRAYVFTGRNNCADRRVRRINMLFAEDGPGLKAAVDALRTSLLVSIAANVVLIMLISTLFDGTGGFCDAKAAAARDSFRFIVLFQILVNAPAFVYYHRADKETAREESGGTPEGLKQSFFFFVVAFLLKVHMTLSTFLSGPFEQRVFIALVGLFVVASFASYACLVRYGNSLLL